MSVCNFFRRIFSCGNSLSSYNRSSSVSSVVSPSSGTGAFLGFFLLESSVLSADSFCNTVSFDGFSFLAELELIQSELVLIGVDTTG